MATEGSPPPTRDELAAQYLDLLPFEPYPVQEEALLTWFTTAEGHLGLRPHRDRQDADRRSRHVRGPADRPAGLLHDAADRADRTEAAGIAGRRRALGIPRRCASGLVTGNRRVNPDAPLLVVVAEILFNRLLREEFDFANVSSVVMDEFHSFNDPERGIVWEFSLGLLPKHVRLMLLSATVGNALEFIQWLKRTNDRQLELVQSDAAQDPA